MLQSSFRSLARGHASAPALGRERQLTVRSLKLRFGEDTPRHWMGGDAWETNLLNALSLIFPGGERFFMRSVRALRDHVTDPTLRALIAQAERELRSMLGRRAAAE